MPNGKREEVGLTEAEEALLEFAEVVEEDGGDDGEEATPKPAMRSLSWDVLRRTKSKPETRAIIECTFEELGIEREEAGANPGDTIGLVFRPFRPGENAEIREAVKDFPAESWAEELYDEIIIHCLLEPQIPDTAEGRKQLKRWQPGTRQTIATAIQNQSGMGAHAVKNAKEELGKLQALTPSI